MLDIPNQPELDKSTLLGSCVRLPLRVDSARLLNELRALPPNYWGTAGGRIGVHRAAEALFLRGYAPAEGDKPIDERPALGLLPCVKGIIERLIPAPPLRCLLARLAPGAVIKPHIDNGLPYFAKTLRVHVPIETHENAWMVCAGQSCLMRCGEVWVLNNSTVHAVWNADADRPRTHLICDFLPTPELLALIARGDRNLGHKMPHVDEHIAAQQPAQAMTGG